MSKLRGSFRAVTGKAGNDAAKNKAMHIPHVVPAQLAPQIKSAQAKAKAGHMKVIAPKEGKLPFSL